MNWTAHPILYQLLHPWHWLAYGQNAAAFQSLTALAGLIGIAFYTYYTRQTTAAALETRRLSLTPCLVASIVPATLDRDEIEVINVAAPAVNCIVWGQNTNNSTAVGLRVRKPSSLPGVMVPVISSAIPFRIPLETLQPDITSLYLVDCQDTAAGVYQLQIFVSLIAETGFTSIENVFIIPDVYVTPLKRFLNRREQRRRLKEMEEAGSIKPHP